MESYETSKTMGLRTEEIFKDLPNTTAALIIEQVKTATLKDMSKYKRNERATRPEDPRVAALQCTDYINVSNKEILSLVKQILAKTFDNRTKGERVIIRKIFENCPFFRELEVTYTVKTLDKLAAEMEYVHLHPGSTLLTYDDLHSSLYYVMQGSLAIFEKRIPTGKQHNDESFDLLNRQPTSERAGQSPRRNNDEHHQLSPQPSLLAYQTKYEKKIANRIRHRLGYANVLNETECDVRHVKDISFGETVNDEEFKTHCNSTHHIIATDEVHLLKIDRENYNTVLINYARDVFTDKLDFLATLPMLTGMKTHVLCEVLLACKEMKFSTGHIIFKEGDFVNKVYFIKQGDFEITRMTNQPLEPGKLDKDPKSKTQGTFKSSQEIAAVTAPAIKQSLNVMETKRSQPPTRRNRLSLLSKGEWFGDIECFQGKISSVTVECVSSDSEVYAIPFGRLVRFLKDPKRLSEFKSRAIVKYQTLKSLVNNNLQVYEQLSSPCPIAVDLPFLKEQNDMIMTSLPLNSGRQAELVQSPRSPAGGNHFFLSPTNNSPHSKSPRRHVAATSMTHLLTSIAQPDEQAIATLVSSGHGNDTDSFLKRTRLARKQATQYGIYHIWDPRNLMNLANSVERKFSNPQKQYQLPNLAVYLKQPVISTRNIGVQQPKQKKSSLATMTTQNDIKELTRPNESTLNVPKLIRSEPTSTTLLPRYSATISQRPTGEETTSLNHKKKLSIDVQKKKLIQTIGLKGTTFGTTRDFPDFHDGKQTISKYSSVISYPSVLSPAGEHPSIASTRSIRPHVSLDFTSINTKIREKCNKKGTKANAFLPPIPKPYSNNISIETISDFKSQALNKLVQTLLTPNKIVPGQRHKKVI